MDSLVFILLTLVASSFVYWHILKQILGVMTFQSEIILVILNWHFVQTWSCVWLLWPHGLQHAWLPCPPLSPTVCSNSRPLSQWYYLNIPSSAALFISCLQSFPASGSFPMSCLFASGGLSIGASASASVLPMNIQCWFPLRLTGLISLQSKGLSRVFSSTIIWKYQFFSAQLSL